MSQFDEINDLLKKKHAISKRIQALASEMNDLAAQREQLRDRIGFLCCTVQPTSTKQPPDRMDKRDMKAILNAMANNPQFIDRLRENLKKGD